MLRAITLLLVLQLVGEVITRALSLPVPGPVLGMFLLFIGLLLRGAAPPDLQATAAGILQHLSILFVPAGVGVMVHLALLRQEWAALLVTLVGSTLIAVVATALSMHFLLRLTRS